ncbi:hypothetical protein [Rudanella lutea]|uniref:hypothetical protein n=1 Tax=Rudanella lutea TaxID=451374 RepID=UPI0003733292|nr:hypothetical protein [Rudanella lutea]
MTPQDPVKPQQRESDSDEIEIRLSDIVYFLKRNRLLIAVGGIVGALLSGIIAFSQRNEFTSVITVMPEVQQKASNIGSLGSLAGLAGIDVTSLAGSSDAIRPDLYTNVTQSVPFNLELLRQNVKSVESNKPVSLLNYIDETEKSWFEFGNEANDDLPRKASGELLQLTKDQEEKVKILQKRIAVIYDKKSSIVTIQSVMTDPIVAAMTAQYTLQYLTDYITSYRTEKARKEVSFLAEQMKQARERYQAAEFALSSYRDRNRSLFLNTAKIEEQRIQADYMLAQDVYNTLSKQYETAKIKVAESTPIFKVLEPARVPLKKSGPQRSIMILAGSIIGVFTVIIVQLLRHLMARQ